MSCVQERVGGLLRCGEPGMHERTALSNVLVLGLRAAHRADWIAKVRDFRNALRRGSIPATPALPNSPDHRENHAAPARTPRRAACRHEVEAAPSSPRSRSRGTITDDPRSHAVSEGGHLRIARAFDERRFCLPPRKCLRPRRPAPAFPSPGVAHAHTTTGHAGAGTSSELIHRRAREASRRDDAGRRRRDEPSVTAGRLGRRTTRPAWVIG